MKYKFYKTSLKAWDGMLKAIDSAQKSIYIEMYIFLADTNETHDFLGKLKAKAQSGIEVVIVADYFGSFDLKSSDVNDLRAAGVEFLFFSHWLRRNHRKFIIIDNRIAFLGGVNIKGKTRYWNDLNIRIEGSIVKPILKSFAYAYRMAGGRKGSILLHQKAALSQKIKSWLLDNWTSRKNLYYLNNYYRQKIIEAKSSIQITTPYLLPPRWLIALFDEAVRRGVNIEIIIPKVTDVGPLNKINYINACRLSSLGVKFYFLPFMNHAKIMLIDGAEGVVGSPNIDILSFGLNMEAGVFFRQKHLIADLEKIFLKWKKEGEFFQNPRPLMKISDRFLVFMLKLFYPIF